MKPAFRTQGEIATARVQDMSNKGFAGGKKVYNVAPVFGTR